MRRRYLAALVAAALFLPPLRATLEATMTTHLLVQLPLLVGAGVLLGRPRGGTDPLAPWNPGGFPAMLLALALFAAATTPRVLDAAVRAWPIDMAKGAALLGAGVLFARAWHPLGAVGQAFVLGNALFMGVVGGLVLREAPERFCTAYLAGDQRVAGTGLVLLATGIGAAWLALAFRRPAGARARPLARVRGAAPLVVAVVAGAVAATTAAGTAGAQQVGDTAFAPPIAMPAFAAGRGPVVALDEAHHNFHTLDGRYAPFGRLLARDGYRVRPLRDAFTDATLRDVDVLVIANALHASNDGGNWTLPTPSAFTDAEIDALVRWVDAGGALMLVADHMPFPGAADALAARFGVRFRNGFVLDADATGGFVMFRRTDGTLAEHAVTRGLAPAPAVDSVLSFTGQGFTLDGDGIALLTIPDGPVEFLPDTAWRFSATTPQRPARGLLQGALLERGRGRVAVFGEAAMFSAQRAGAQRAPMGMNAPAAAGNVPFLRHVIRWLADPPTASPRQPPDRSR